MKPPQPDPLLDWLAESDGWRSGEEIAGRLGISRAAVAKRVATLRRAGHAIESTPRRGHRLLARADVLTEATVKPWLRTRSWGRGAWRVAAETGSTNDDAIALLAEGAPEGDVVLAERQTRGKGRKAHGWFTAPRGLHFSVTLRPTRAGKVESLTQAAAEVVARTVGGVFAPPNDVMLDGYKVAGILVETGWRGGELDWAVLGVGCNVNALATDFPPALRKTAGSLLGVTGQWRDRPALLAELLRRIETRYLRLRP